MTQLDLEAAPVEIGEIMPPQPAKVPARAPRATKPARAPESETAQVLGMIANATRDPAVDVLKLEKLFELRERVADAEARRAFNAAVADAKGKIGPIVKDKMVDFENKRSDARTSYRFEGFDTIARAVDPVLNEFGLSYRFRSQNLPEKRLRVTCILSHRDGYSEETSLESFEDHSGNKNPIQAIGSAATYLQRYTLKLALGLSATTDDDGRASGGTDDGDTITAQQRETLQRRLVELDANIPVFLDLFGVDHINDFPAKRFNEALRRLDEKERRERQGNRQ